MEMMAIQVSNIIIVNVYHPPSNPIDTKALSFVNKYRNVILCGDFNAHHKMWDKGSPNVNGNRLVDFVEQYDYSVLNVTLPTHLSFTKNIGVKSALIDLAIATPNTALECDVEVTNNLMGSDHCIIKIMINH